MRRFLILFPVFLIFGFGVLQTTSVTTALDVFTQWLAGLSGIVIHVFGGRTIVHGATLESPTGVSITVKNGCNAINVMILLWSAILPYPATRRQKLNGLVVGSVVLHAVNILRIISLYYLVQYNRAWFEFAHLYLWESLIVLDTLVIFWLWAASARSQ